MAPDKSTIEKLTYEEKLEWLEALIASIASDPAVSETPDWHREIIRERLERMRTDPHPGFSIEEVFERLEKRAGEKLSRRA